MDHTWLVAESKLTSCVLLAGIGVTKLTLVSQKHQTQVFCHRRAVATTVSKQMLKLLIENKIARFASGFEDGSSQG